MQRLISATDRDRWNEALDAVGEIDCTCLPDYHLAYALRVVGSAALLFHFSEGGQHFAYPFLLTPVLLQGEATGHHDISSIYGYTGPLASSTDAAFIAAAWHAFDIYTSGQHAIAEFIRFSPFNRNEGLAHPQAKVQANREVAASYLPDSREELLQLLGSKTRNMLRKAEREGLVAHEVDLPSHLPQFRALYEETMRRNGAPEFFLYDDAYWHHMLALVPGGLRLFGTFREGAMVAAAMAVAHGRSGLYHLGASLSEYARLGAGNLCLFAMSCGLMEDGVDFLNMTGGRTAAGNDPLFLFKRSNATATATFHISRRIINATEYNELAVRWQRRCGEPPSPDRVIFWR